MGLRNLVWQGSACLARRPLSSLTTKQILPPSALAQGAVLRTVSPAAVLGFAPSLVATACPAAGQALRAVAAAQSVKQRWFHRYEYLATWQQQPIVAN